MTKKSSVTSSKLFRPIRIGAMSLENRIIMSAMETNFGKESGEVSQRLIDYYAERAKARPGLIVVQPSAIENRGKISKYQLLNSDDRFVPGLTQLARAIKENSAKCAIQVFHGGRGSPTSITGQQPVAPSDIPIWGGDLPHVLTEEEIREFINKYAEAVRRIKSCGFDAAELHFGHGYLGAQFLSPLTNKRRDKYGGNLENRARFCLEIIAAVRRLVEKDYPLLVRFGPEDIKGGITVRESTQIAQMFEAAGVDAIDVTTGYRASSEEGYLNCIVPRVVAPMHMPRGCFVEFAETIKKKVSIPVIVVGRINDLLLAEQILEENKADLVAMGRAFLSDPEFLPKWIDGRPEDIRKCIACNACQTFLAARQPVQCALNADLSRQEPIKITPTARKKKVLVVGGGPAGMEAARIAARRGHQVTLAEKENKLGGNLRVAARPSFKNEIASFTEFLTTQVKKAGVAVKLGVPVDVEFVKRLQPDALILANGARPVRSKIKGIEKTAVTDAIEVLLGKAKVGQEILVIGGGRVGCEVAAFLASQGKHITIVEIRSTDFGPNEGLASDEESMTRRWLLFDLWPTLDIRVIGNATVKEITDKGAVINRGGVEQVIKCDNVICAMGMTPTDELKEGSGVAETYVIGDSKESRTILEAVHEGAEAGLKV
ncbi:FAD-dependent oxidoreductase [Chloroflexota bacterium]